LIEPAVFAVPSTFGQAPSQAKNTWSVFAVPPDEMTPILQETVNCLNKKLEQTQDQLTRTQNQLAQIQNQVETFITSTSWRVTIPMRYIGLHLPVPLRRQLRRALKAIWWAVTPWRMPARLRFLRQRKTVQRVAIAQPPAECHQGIQPGDTP
jgi:hypothetical protein